MTDLNTMLDWIVLLTSSVATGAADAIGADAWQKVKGLLGLGPVTGPEDVTREELASRLEEAIRDDYSTLAQLQRLLAASGVHPTDVHNIAGLINTGKLDIEAKNVTIIQNASSVNIQ